MPKVAEIESMFEIGRRNCLLVYWAGCAAAMTWWAVWRGTALVWVKRMGAKTGGVLTNGCMACEESDACGRCWPREL
jgi:hypothetical protein